MIAADELEQCGAGVELAALLCGRCESDQIGPLGDWSMPANSARYLGRSVRPDSADKSPLSQRTKWSSAYRESFRLRSKWLRFHELEYDELRAACVGPTEPLLGLNTIIDLDHKLLWSWCVELLLGRGAPYAHDVDREIARLAALAVRCALAGTSTHTREAFDQSGEAPKA
jgi:hypothetical protein